MSTGYTWSLTGSFVYCSVWLGGWGNRPSRSALPTESTNRLAGLPSRSYILDLLIRPPETNWKLRYGKVVHEPGYMVLLGDSWGWGWKLRPGILNWTSEPAGCLSMVGWKLSMEFKACPEWSAGAAPWFLRSAEEFAAERGWFGPVGCCLLSWPELDFFNCRSHLYLTVCQLVYVQAAAGWWHDGGIESQTKLTSILSFNWPM